MAISLRSDRFARRRPSLPTVADSSMSLRATAIKSRGFIDDEIERNRKVYLFLRSALNSEVGRGILLRASSPTEAWRNLESWHNSEYISATQASNDRFQSYYMKPGKNPLIALSALEEMASQPSQQRFPWPRTNLDPIPPDPTRIPV